MIDERTEHLNLTLPHPDNSLADDVMRMRTAFADLDTKISQIDFLLGSDDPLLDQVQELVNAIKDNRDTIDALLNGKADATDLTVLEEVQVLSDGQTIVDLAELSTTSGCAVYVEGIRLNKTEWTPDLSIQTRFTLSTSYPAGHTIAVVRLQGGV